MVIGNRLVMQDLKQYSVLYRAYVNEWSNSLKQLLQPNSLYRFHNNLISKKLFIFIIFGIIPYIALNNITASKIYIKNILYKLYCHDFLNKYCSLSHFFLIIMLFLLLEFYKHLFSIFEKYNNFLPTVLNKSCNKFRQFLFLFCVLNIKNKIYIK